MTEIPDEAKLTHLEIGTMTFANDGRRQVAAAAAEKAWHARDAEVAELMKDRDDNWTSWQDTQEERDAALEQVRALVAAWEYKNDWEARDEETSDCHTCTWDSGPYTISCEEHNPDAPMERATTASKRKESKEADEGRRFGPAKPGASRLRWRCNAK